MNNFGLPDVDKIIIETLELDELKQLVCANKYFNLLINSTYPKLRKTLIVLDEFHKTFADIKNNFMNCYSYHLEISQKQINRKLHEHIFGLLRKNKILLTSKIINHMNKYHDILDLPGGLYYYRIFDIVIEDHYTNEHKF